MPQASSYFNLSTRCLSLHLKTYSCIRTQLIGLLKNLMRNSIFSQQFGILIRSDQKKNTRKRSSCNDKSHVYKSLWVYNGNGFPELSFPKAVENIDSNGKRRVRRVYTRLMRFVRTSKRPSLSRFIYFVVCERRRRSGSQVEFAFDPKTKCTCDHH